MARSLRGGAPPRRTGAAAGPSSDARFRLCVPLSLAGIAPRENSRLEVWGLLSGTSMLIGAALLIIKSLAILISGSQPPLLFEISPLFLGLGVLAVAHALALEGPRWWIVSLLGATSVIAGIAAGATEVAGEVSGPAIAATMLAAIGGAVVSGWRPRGDSRKWALLLVGMTVIPAMVVGGLLEAINERLLEIGLLGYAGVWGLAGLRIVLGRESPSRPS